jgi:hypothetical protein
MTEHIKNRFTSIFLTAFLLIFLLFPALNCFAANTGFQADEHPAPESVKEIKSQFGPAIKEKRRSFFPAFREKMKSLPPFWRDTSLLLHLRTYYLYRDIEPDIKSEDPAYGRTDCRSAWPVIPRRSYTALKTGMAHCFLNPDSRVSVFWVRLTLACGSLTA